MLSKNDLVKPDLFERWKSKHGHLADQWLEQSWQKLENLTHQWDLSSLQELDGGSESIVVAAKRAEDDVVVKLIPPWRLFLDSEMIALRAWKGRGAPRLIDVDGSAILMERISPGNRSGDKDLEEIVGLFQSLTVSVRPPGLIDLALAVLARFERARENRHGLVSPEDLKRATLSAISLASPLQSESTGLVHGDLLSKNILFSSKRGIVAIDPMASWGDRTFDLALWSVTEEPVSDAIVRATTLARILGFDVDRTLQWIPPLLTAEACLASYKRAYCSFEVLRSLAKNNNKEVTIR